MRARYHTTHSSTRWSRSRIHYRPRITPVMENRSHIPSLPHNTPPTESRSRTPIQLRITRAMGNHSSTFSKLCTILPTKGPGSTCLSTQGNTLR